MLQKAYIVLVLWFLGLASAMAQVSPPVAVPASAPAPVPVPESSQVQLHESPWALPSAGFGAGMLSFNGDVGRADPVTSLTKIRFGANCTVEERIGKWLGISLTTIYGTLAASDRTPTLNRNFESKISQTDIHFVFHFDNDFILKKSLTVAPYLSIGFGYLKFNPYGVLKDKNGDYYYYWTDGGIHNAPQSVNPNAPLVPLDYSNATRLTDSSYNYKRSTYCIPLTAGFRLKMSPELHADLSISYYYTFSGYIDNYRTGNDLDSYFYTSVGLSWNFRKKPKKIRYLVSTVDFDKLDEMDSDKDGVKDLIDECPDTPKGVEVDAKGCPLDADNDGIPDYRDREPHSKPGALVDENGITLSTKLVVERFLAAQAAEFKKPSVSVYFHGVLPAKFKYADLNSDGIISYDELIAVLSNMFDSNTVDSVEQIRSLIDYYFQQQ